MLYIKACMELDVPQIEKAGIYPSVEQLEDFNEHIRRNNDGIEVNNLSALLSSFTDGAKLDAGKYMLSDDDEMRMVANWLHPIPLSLRDRYDFYTMVLQHELNNILVFTYLYGLLYPGVLLQMPQLMQEILQRLA